MHAQKQNSVFQDNVLSNKEVSSGFLTFMSKWTGYNIMEKSHDLDWLRESRWRVGKHSDKQETVGSAKHLHCGLGVTEDRADSRTGPCTLRYKIPFGNIRYKME